MKTPNTSAADKMHAMHIDVGQPQAPVAAVVADVSLATATGDASVEKTLNRRGFLKLSGVVGAGLVIGLGLPDSQTVLAATAPGSFEPSAFLKIGADGKIVLLSKNPEIGQGIKTSLPQILAEELEVPWESIEVQQGNLDERFGDQFAGGSTGVKTNFELVRKAGAAAREMLEEAAARKWRTSLDQVYAKAGYVHRRNSNEKLSYGELADAAAKLEVRENPKLKNTADFTLIGKALPGVDNKAIVTGTATFGLDAKPKGMMVACIERSPVYGGKIKSIDDVATLKVPGVQQIVRIDATENRTRLVAGVAVVATNTWAAMKGRKALKVTWDTGTDAESDDALRNQFQTNITSKGQLLRDDGNVDQALPACKKTHEATFEAPFLAHAPMEPMNYIADVRADGATLWGPTQVPGSVRMRAVEITGLAPDKIDVRMTRVGGGFGRRLMADYACEAIFVSKAIGKPVQVVWTREDDIQHDFYRPAGMYKIKAGLDENNALHAWHITASTTSRGQFSNPKTETPHTTEVFPDGFPAGFVPNFRMEYTPLISKVPRGAWRAPGHNVTTWIDQCFTDEMAQLAGKDPVKFRLELLGDDDKLMPYADHGGPVYSTKRLKNVIRMAADKVGWDKPAPKGIYRGFAAHFMFGAYVAEVVSISMGANNAFKIDNVLAVVDCGIVINRSNAVNQLQGGIIDGLSAALNQALHIENGKAREGNFDEYKLLRMKDAPAIDIVLVDSNESPEGLGEMSLPPVAAALCNALYAATGKRIHKLPINQPDKRTA